MQFPRRRFLHLAASAAAFAVVSRIARAQAYPTRPVRIIVGFAPGSATDTIARLIAQKLSENLGNRFYVENITGAGGNIAMGRAAQAAPDGYTALFVGPSYVINPALYGKIPYDPLKSFDPISLTGTTNVLLVVNPSVPVQTVKDLIALIKATPGKYSYASGGGIGSPGGLVGEQFRLSLGLDLVHVPFNGANLAVGATMAGQPPIGFVAPAPAAPLILEGRLRALAGTGKTRLEVLPSVPTFAEVGYPDILGESWFGFVVPIGAPKQILALLNREIAKINLLPEMKPRLATLGFQPITASPEEFADLIKVDLVRWREVIHAAGVKVE